VTGHGLFSTTSAQIKHESQPWRHAVDGTGAHGDDHVAIPRRFEDRGRHGDVPTNTGSTCRRPDGARQRAAVSGDDKRLPAGYLGEQEGIDA
jgi:hypothetical protein